MSHYRPKDGKDGLPGTHGKDGRDGASATNLTATDMNVVLVRLPS